MPGHAATSLARSRVRREHLLGDSVAPPSWPGQALHNCKYIQTLICAGAVVPGWRVDEGWFVRSMRAARWWNSSTGTRRPPWLGGTAGWDEAHNLTWGAP